MRLYQRRPLTIPPTSLFPLSLVTLCVYKVSIDVCSVFINILTMTFHCSQLETGMVLPRLPQELIEHIIDLIKDDEQTLHSCALTCFSWTRRSQEHLHRSLRFSEGHRTIVQELYNSRELADFVYQIDIRCKPPHPWHRMFQPMDPQPSRWLKDEDTYHTLAIFPNVNTYRLSYMHFSLPVIEKLGAFFSTSPSPITTLEIYEASFDNLEGFATLLASFPKLSCLKIDRCQWPHDHNFSFEKSQMFRLETGKIPGPELRTLRVMVHSRMRTDITKWCFATGIASEFLEWKWEGHAHRAIFDPSIYPSGALSIPVRLNLAVMFHVQTEIHSTGSRILPERCLISLEARRTYYYVSTSEAIQISPVISFASPSINIL